jgi:exopolyphosphatase / guanosine-5'-triphosphate,3'-diphosphate pyrophosphatase
VRVAAVDLGTNTTRLLVADVTGGRVDEVSRRLVITRMGEAVDERKLLLPTAIARVRNVLSDYRREAEALGAERVLAVATSAARDAANGEAFLGEIEWSYGFATRLLTGDDEAALTLRGIASSHALPAGTLVVDIGGGSTELVVVGPNGVETQTSLQLGSVRLTERYLHADPPTGAELDVCADHVRSQLPTLAPTSAIGVAGTVTTLATIDLGLAAWDPARSHGHVVARAAVEEIFARLASLPLAERERVAGLEPARAPVIVAGIAVIREVLDAYGLEAIEVSERDILHGIALAAAELPERAEGDAPPQTCTCC